MGRSGGGGGGFSGGGGGFSGGGGFGGGFSGGGGSGGGFSGGHSGGRSSGPGAGGGPAPRPHGPGPGGPGMFGGFHPPVMLHVPVGRVGNGGSSNGNGGNNNGNSGGGCLSNIGGVLIAIIIIALFFGVLGSFGSCATHRQGEPAGVTASTVEREKLSGVNYGTDEGYFTDADGDWIHNSARMEAGLKEFYEQTGVQPYVYILPNGQETSPTRLGEMAEDLYNQLFDDGAHFLLVFCDDGLGGYNCGYWVGPEAKTVMDSEAISVLADYLDRYYAEAATEEEIFSEAFAKTAERIMYVEESSVPYVVIGFAIVVIAGVVVFIVKKRSEAKEAERKHKEAILNTPLEKFGDSSIDELEKKYAQDDGASAEDLAKKYDK